MVYASILGSLTLIEVMWQRNPLKRRDLIRAVLFFKRRLKQAIREFEQVLAIDPDHEDARYNLHIVRSRQKKRYGNGSFSGSSGPHL